MDTNKLKHDEFKKIDEWYIETTSILNKLKNISRSFDVSFLQYNILLLIHQNDKLTPTEIAEEMDISVSSSSRSLRSLKKKGLILKTHNSQDERITKISNTNKGNELLESITKNIIDKNIII